MQVELDLELRDYLPPTSEDERKRLKESLLRDGCEEPLIVWKETGKLVDGYNRHEICIAENIPFDLEFRSFGDLDEVHAFMLNRQLGRRNLRDAQRNYFIGLAVKIAKKTMPAGAARKKVAAEADSSERTAARGEELVDALNAHAPENPRKQQELLQTKTQKEIIVTAPLCSRCQRVGPPPSNHPCKACEEIRKGKRKKPKVTRAPAYDATRGNLLKASVTAAKLLRLVTTTLLQSKAGATLQRNLRSFDAPIVMQFTDELDTLGKPTWPVMTKILEAIRLTEKSTHD